MDGNENAAGGDLPIWGTASAAAGFGFRMIRFAAMAAVLVATVLALLMLIGLIPTPSLPGAPVDTPTPATGPLGDMITLVMTFVLTAVFTVFFHRRVMLDHVVPVRLQLTGREWRFLGATLVYSLAMFVPALLLFLLAGAFAAAGLAPLTMAIVAVVSVAVVFLFIRFALAFPAIAVDAPGSLVDQFKYSFAATRGRFWQLLGIYLAAYLIFIVLAVVVSLVLGMVVATVAAAGASVLVATWLGLFVQVTLQFMALAMFASIASQAFMAWSGWEPASGLPGTDETPLA